MELKKIFSTGALICAYIILLSALGFGAKMGYDEYVKTVKSSGEDKKKSLRKAIKIFRYNPLNMLESKDEHAFERSIFHIENLGKEGVDRLISTLNEPEMTDKKRSNIIYIFGRLGKSAKKGAEFIKPYLRDSNKEIRGTTARALAKMNDKSSAKSIALLLFDKDKWVRESAVTALRMINTPEARKSLRDYDEIQQDSN